MGKTHGTTSIVKRVGKNAQEMLSKVAAKFDDLTDEVDIAAARKTVQDALFHHDPPSAFDIGSAKNQVKLNNMKHKVVTGSKTIANHISRIGKLGVDCIESAAKNTLSNFKNAFDGTSEAEEEASINRPYPLTSTDNTGTTGYHREYLPSDPHAFQWRSFIVVCAILMLTCLLMFCVYLFIDYRRRKSSPFNQAADLELGYRRYEI